MCCRLVCGLFLLGMVSSSSAAFVSSFDGLTDRQVVQRDDTNEATIPIVASFTGAVDSVEFRTVPIEGSTATTTGWLPLASADGVNFLIDATLSGGWYQLELQALNQGVVVDTASVAHFGVGEVFVIAGQSNAANTAETSFTPNDDRVNALALDSLPPPTGWTWDVDPGEWRHGYDPQPIATHVFDPNTRGTSWPLLGDLLASYYDVPVGWTNVAWNGSSVSLYADPNNPRHTRLMDAVQAFGMDGVRSVIWHQGETDVSMDPNLYAQHLNSVIDQTRAAAGYDVVWGVALVAARDGQQMVIDEDPLVFEGADTDTIGFEHRIGVHWAESGQIIHAQLWYEQIVPMINSAMGNQLMLGDINNDGVVDVADLGVVGGQWGRSGNGDLNLDSVVDTGDLGILGANWTHGIGVTGAVSTMPTPTAALGVIGLLGSLMLRRTAVGDHQHGFQNVRAWGKSRMCGSGSADL